MKIWEHFFKPEIRTSGLSLFSKGKISIQQPSDTEIIGFVRVSPPVKVSLKSKSVSSKTVISDCNCTVGKKGLFCKHIWAVLLASHESHSDFFDSKSEIEKVGIHAKVSLDAKSSDAQKIRNLKQMELKEKQKLYRKIQYQKQKLRLNEYKLKKSQAPENSHPKEVEQALTYFSNNGFELRTALMKETVGSAKKSLARIFHPDFGGSQNEILELNRHAKILEDFIKLKN